MVVATEIVGLEIGITISIKIGITIPMENVTEIVAPDAVPDVAL
ncbi:hypothetical protein [Bacillus sp. EB600]|nr:hypothetical protein [Bacillus sp. EB600]